MQHPNFVEFEVYGPYGLFSDPITRIGGEKCSYQIPTYEAIKGVLSSVYWKPTIIWYVDEVRVLNRIQTEVKGIRPIKYNGGNELAYYTYLKNCRYQVRAHFEWNMNRPELAGDRNENKHHEMAKKMIRRGGRRDVFLGARECQAYVEPCVYGEGAGYYDDLPQLSFGVMYHGVTYADEAYSEQTKGRMTVNLWRPVMQNGVIRFLRPEDCPMHKPVKEMDMKRFDGQKGNFTAIEQAEEVN